MLHTQFVDGFQMEAVPDLVARLHVCQQGIEQIGRQADRAEDFHHLLLHLAFGHAELLVRIVRVPADQVDVLGLLRIAARQPKWVARAPMTAAANRSVQRPGKDEIERAEPMPGPIRLSDPRRRPMVPPRLVGPCAHVQLVRPG